MAEDRRLGREAVCRALASAALLASLAGALTGQVHDPRALAADPAAASGPIAPVLEGLGDHHFPVTTSEPRSQQFFDQGLRLTYGFNHSEALRAFKEAARLDPSNAMAYWGWALVLGPNLNLPMLPEVAGQAYQASRAALELEQGVSPRERAFIEALAVRYSDDPEAERGPLDRAYAEAMGRVHREWPQDPDAATLYAAALMELSPWDYWHPDGRPRERTGEILSLLEGVIARHPRHAGAHHYYIHAVEAHHPEKGVASAEVLGELTPGAGHLVHMPSHIYMRTGRYADSWEANARAAAADERYISQCRAQGLYPLAYYPHNVHFMVWAAMFQGRSADALEMARKVAAGVPAERSGDAWFLYDAFLSQPLYVLVRFGRWDEILAEPRPAPATPFRTGIWHYARGLAFVHTGATRRARRELAALDALREEPELAEQYVGFGPVPRLLTIASEILAGELAARRGRRQEALARLGRAVRIEDGLLYNEPPDWYFPVRHLLGAMLLEAGHPAEAEVIYWEDLRRAPENGYALFGLAQSLRAQGKDEAAAEVEARFRTAWAQADIELTSSRF